MYCDPQVECGGLNNVQMLGVNNCDDCDVTWSPTHTLSDHKAKFPVVSNDDYWDAFEKVYDVTMITPEGCIFNDQVTFLAGVIDVEATTTVGACSFRTDIDIMLDLDIPNEFINIKVTNLVNNQVVLDLVNPTGNGLNRQFSFGSFRDSDKHFKIEVSLVDYDSFCFNGNCKDVVFGEYVPWSHYTGQWRAYLPNSFSPNGDGVNDSFSVNFAILDGSCDEVNPYLSSITSYKLELFDYWGSLVFSSSISIDPLVDLDGILGGEIAWDGIFNEEPAITGTYTAKVTVTSCYEENFVTCYNPQYLDPYYHSQSGGEEIFAFAFTLFR